MSLSSVDANTTSLGSSEVIILEGDSVDISCLSVGAPVPIVTWELNNQSAVYMQTDIVTQYEATVIGDVGNIRVDVIPGNTLSTHHVVNARFPENDGVYTCVGTNSDDPPVTSNASVTIHVYGMRKLVSFSTVTCLYVCVLSHVCQTSKIASLN